MKPWALVTGASRGIGAAIAEALAAAGHPVLANYRSDERAAAELKDRIETAGGRVELARFDVTDGQATREHLDRFLAEDRPIGVVVNNAGISRDAPFPTIEPEAWTSVTRTTLDGFYSTGAGGPTMLATPPNPNAVKIFLNWSLSREGQIAYQEPRGFLNCPGRADLQIDEMCRDEIRLSENGSFLDTALETVSFTRDISAAVAQEALGGR